ncbi:MAG: hemolysin III family protein [Proteobacteria bacterium]|nr:hemolysin III family protein [Pseudomonadota bacterium]
MGISIKEPVNAISHFFGALFSIAGLSVLVSSAAIKASAWHVVSFSIFGTTLILLYSSSTLYHAITLSEKGERAMRRLDHIMIYLLIAGTYTPFCLVPLRGVLGWSIFGVIWGIAIAGITIKIFWFNLPRWVSTAMYLGMGWTCIVVLDPLIKSIPGSGLFFLGMGGLFYTTGAIIYGLKAPNPIPGILGFHEIWHFFVLAGSACHFWAMYKYVLYL